MKGLEKPVQAIEVVSEVELPPVPYAAPADARGGDVRFVLAAGAVILLVGIATAAAVLIRDGDPASDVLQSVVPDSLAVVDPKTNGIVGQVQIPGRPSLVAAADGSIWVASAASRTVSSISPDGEPVAHACVAPNATPHALAAEGDAVWVA